MYNTRIQCSASIFDSSSSSGSSIGANIAEAIYGSSRKDFAAKLQIAQKEAAETLYWLELLNETQADHIYYTINGTDEPVPEDALYFHASFRRTNPLKYGEDFVIADGIRGKGRFAGCYLTWQQNNKCWWGEGEVKMFIDGDKEFPSICGTGTEDYFCGAWCFADRTFSSPYSGYHCGGASIVGQRHALYRFHITDPVWFQSDFKATVQALGWRSEKRFLPLQDDLSCVAYWYQTEPHAPLPSLPDRNGLEVI